MVKQVALLVQTHHLAARTETGVDGKDALAAQGWGEQQLAHVLREQVDGLIIGFLLALGGKLGLNLWLDQTLVPVFGGFGDQVGVSVRTLYRHIGNGLLFGVRRSNLKRAAGMIAGYAVAGIAMNMLMEGVTAGSGRKDDDDEKRLNALRNIIFYGTTQFTDSVPLIGSYLTTVTQKALTGRSTYLSTGTDMTPMITKLGSAVMSVSNGNWAKAAGQFGEGVGLALGLPTSGIKEIYKFFTDEDGNFDVGLSTIYGLAKDITGGKGSSKK